MTEEIYGLYRVRETGCVGQEILDPGGRIIAWTTNGWTAQVICKLLSKYHCLLLIEESDHECECGSTGYECSA